MSVPEFCTKQTSHGQTLADRMKPLNSTGGCMCAMHLQCFKEIRPNLELTTWPKQLLGPLLHRAKVRITAEFGFIRLMLVPTTQKANLSHIFILV
jgi:hypothetical protein